MGSKPWDSSRPEGAGTPGEPVLWNAFAYMAGCGWSRRHDRPGRGARPCSTLRDSRIWTRLASLPAPATLGNWARRTRLMWRRLRSASSPRTRCSSLLRPAWRRTGSPGRFLGPRRRTPRCSSPRAAGSKAVDSAIKLPRGYWRVTRPRGPIAIALSHAYHGMNAYGTSLGGIPANTEPFVLLQRLPGRAGGLGRPAGAGQDDRAARCRAGRRLLLRAGRSVVAVLSCCPGATWPACGRSAAATTCCSSPTR